MTSIQLHPSELAYAFSYARVEELVGWGKSPLTPSENGAGDPKSWMLGGEARMLEAGHLIGDPEGEMTFTDDITSAVVALVNPNVVLMVERKADEGLRRMTVHSQNGDFIGLTRNSDGDFEMTRYADLTAAAAACAAFVGASLDKPDTEARIEANLKLLGKMREFASQGLHGPVNDTLLKMGASKANAASATKALAAPKSAGVFSVLYCAGNAVQDAEAFTAMTNAEDETWVLFAPANPDGPMVLERSSIADLAARVSVGIAARLI